MNILITSAGQRVSLLNAFSAELKKRYPDAKIFAADMNPGLSPACQVADECFTVKRCTDPDYIDELLSLCSSRGIRMVVPTIDTELAVLASGRERFDALGIHVIVSSSDVVATCRDKRKTNGFFQSRGIEVPQAIDRNNPTFPLFIKPYDGSLSVDTVLVRSSEDLKARYLDERFMFMEYFDKERYDEYTVDMYFDRSGRVRCIVPRKRIFVRAGEVNKAVTRKNALVSVLADKLAHVEGARGCLTAQFFFGKTTERIVGIEVNARFGGGYPLSYRAGANYPKWLIGEYFKGEEPGYFEDWEDGMLMLRYDAEVLVRGYPG